MLKDIKTRSKSRLVSSSSLLYIVCFLLSPINILAQTTTHPKSFLADLISARTIDFKVAFTYEPKYPTAGQTVQFVDVSTGSPTSWDWDFGDGSTSTAQNPSHKYSIPGIRKVTLVAINNAGSRKSVKTITIMPDAAASFVFSPMAPRAGQTVQFTDTTPGDPTAWQWDFGDGGTSTSKNPSHIFLKAASYTVTLISSKRFGSRKASKTVTVASMSVLSSSFIYLPILPSTGQTVQFTDTSAGTPTSWQWNFGDGGASTSQNPSHSYTSAGAKTVTLTVTNASGSNSTTKTVTVAAALTASFSYSPLSPVAGQAVQFTDTSAGSPAVWQWDFNDGTYSTVQNPSHTFLAAGVYGVTLVVTSGSASNSANQAIIVGPASTLVTSFYFSPASPTVGQLVQFTDSSVGNPTSWQWCFGDGATSTSRNPSHAFAGPAIYEVTLTALNNSASMSVSRTINVTNESTIIPSNRKVDWSRAGVWVSDVKGIPSRTSIFCNVKTGIPGSSLLARGDGVQDDTAALQAAINACPAGQVVLVPQGTYRISGILQISKGIVVRGEGPNKTRIINYSNNWIFRISGSGINPNPKNVLSGFQKGSDTVTVSDGTPFAPGYIVTMDQLNEAGLVTPTGVGTCTWCGRDGLGGTRAYGETMLVKSRSGNTVTFNRPLYYNFQSSYLPQLYVHSHAPIENAGIEDLYIESAVGNTAGGGILMTNCRYCWVKGVEGYNFPEKHVVLRWGTYGNEIRYNYFHGAQSFAGDRGYGIHIFGNSCDNLIEDNILYYLHTGVAFEAGGAGNVVAYNHIERTQHGNDPQWFQAGIVTHGAHPYMNLIEGNVVNKVHLDGYWGSGSHTTVFRNHITRLNPGTPVIYDLTAVIVDSKNYYDTFVANVLGTSGCSGQVEQIPYSTFEKNPVLWKIGYNCCAEDGNPIDPKVADTLIRTGNWECSANAVQWSTAERSLPDSLYLPSKPVWFGVLNWPPFTPDREGFNPSNLNKIPAQVRFENGPAIGLPYTLIRGY